jgi:hypothetical protein
MNRIKRRLPLLKTPSGLLAPTLPRPGRGLRPALRPTLARRVLSWRAVETKRYATIERGERQIIDRASAKETHTKHQLSFPKSHRLGARKTHMIPLPNWLCSSPPPSVICPRPKPGSNMLPSHPSKPSVLINVGRYSAHPDCGVAAADTGAPERPEREDESPGRPEDDEGGWFPCGVAWVEKFVKAAVGDGATEGPAAEGRIL